MRDITIKIDNNLDLLQNKSLETVIQECVTCKDVTSLYDGVSHSEYLSIQKRLIDNRFEYLVIFDYMRLVPRSRRLRYELTRDVRGSIYQSLVDKYLLDLSNVANWELFDSLLLKVTRYHSIEDVLQYIRISKKK